MVGTVKGAFFFSSDEARRDWRIEGPLLKGWEVSNFTLDRRGEPALWACVGSYVYGPTIQVSRDLGRRWTQIEHGPRYGEDSGRKLERIWCVEPGHPEVPARRTETAQIPFDVGDEDRRTETGEAFGQHLQADGLAGTRGTGDQAVAISHATELAHQVSIAAADRQRLLHYRCHPSFAPTARPVCSAQPPLTTCTSRCG